VVFVVGDLVRQGFGFANPNHAAAAICALFPFCWGWRGKWRWAGRLVGVALCVMLAMTYSRTGMVVLAMEAIAMCKCKVESVKCKMAALDLVLLGVAVAVWLMWPRLTIDDSILNRPRIWLAGLRLFAANPSGVGLGNSGAVASAFLLPDIPEIRTMISAHITLLAEFGWRVGLVWLSFILLALPGLRRSPRVGIAFAGLVVSGCSSTIFDWPVLFDASDFGGLGVTNWILSWAMLLMFVVMGCLLIAKSVVPWRRKLLPRVLFATAFAGALLGTALTVPKGGAPTVRNGYVFRGETPRTLALYDDGWRLRTVLPRVGGAAVLPVHAVSRFPHDVDLSGVGKVMLFGNCREWSHLVKGVPVLCSED
jgi:hypothetical protein